MPQGKPNAVLIGMPASGKSTVGPIVADRLGWAFMDTDKQIERTHGRPLAQLLDPGDPDSFCRLEEACVLQLACRDTVIATGGSVVYGRQAVAHLREIGTVVYLHTPLALLEMRISDMVARAVVRRPRQTLSELLTEREPLYRAVADITIDCTARTPARTADEIIWRLATFDPLPGTGT